MKNLALMTVFNTIQWWHLIVAYFLGPICIFSELFLPATSQAPPTAVFPATFTGADLQRQKTQKIIESL